MRQQGPINMETKEWCIYCHGKSIKSWIFSVTFYRFLRCGKYVDSRIAKQLLLSYHQLQIIVTWGEWLWNLLLWVFVCFWGWTGLDVPCTNVDLFMLIRNCKTSKHKHYLWDYLKEYSNIYDKSLGISDQKPKERFWSVQSAIVSKGKTMNCFCRYWKDYLL